MARRKVKRVLGSSRLDARPFRPSRADVQRWVEVLNYIMFEGKLPKFRKVTIRRMHAYGACLAQENRRGRFCHLEIRDKFDSFAAFYCILAHEMCHAAEWINVGRMSHGRFFFSHREMLNKMGIRLQIRY